jgi:hypothetical protein
MLLILRGVVSINEPLPLASVAQIADQRCAIASQVETILAHSIFQRAPRLTQLFRFAVQMSLEGKTHLLKEYTIAVDVFARPESFDCRLDSIVRVEVARLRKKLDRYYRIAGTEDRVVIKLPRSGYQPVVWFRNDDTIRDESGPTVALIESTQNSAADWSTSELPFANIARISRDSLESFERQYDLIVVLLGNKEQPSDFSWAVDAAARHTSALLLVPDTGSKASLLALSEAVKSIVDDGQMSRSFNRPECTVAGCNTAVSFS